MPKILVIYHSQEYGNTEAMAKAVAEGIMEAGAQVELFNTNKTRVTIEKYKCADAAAFGSPDYFSYIAGGLKVFLDDWYIAKEKRPSGLLDKKYALFYSHGGGGRVREPLEKLFKHMGVQVGKTLESKGKPDKKVLDECKALGRQLAESVNKKD